MDSVIARQLEVEVESWLQEPFKLGVRDCGMAGANFLSHLYGYDCAESVRGRYENLEQLKELLGPLGLGGLMRRLAKQHGWRRVAPEEAEPGSVGLVFNGMSGVVICCRKGWYFARGQSGVSLVPAINPVYPHNSVRLAWDTRPCA